VSFLASLSAEARDELRAFVAAAVADALADREGPAGSPWLSLEEAAEYLRVSERTLERAIARGRLDSTTIGRRRLVRREDLDELGNGGGEAPATPPRRPEGV
jgi:excisionase family DNA binding protein